jgi:hypothetical protein
MKYIIYKITIADYVYIGSTKNYTRRKSQHKFDCNNKVDRLLYNTINELGGWSNCIISPIEQYEADTNIQARIREEHFRQEFIANLNMVRCFRTDEQKHEQAKEYDKAYKKEHANEIKEYQKTYRQFNKKKQLAITI